MFKKRTRWREGKRGSSWPPTKINFKSNRDASEWSDWLEKVKFFCCKNEPVFECTKVPGDNRPFIEIYIGNINLLALIDSGANASFISLAVWRKLSKSFQNSFSKGQM